MPLTFASLTDLLNHGFDTVIDVRSPAEFDEDHMPGAINLPALSNDERAEVGTIYTQFSAFRARKIGAAKVARNVATHLEGPLKDMDGGWQPLVYCWRGGQRSGSFASILTQIGWRAETMQGGYQSYRRLVHRLLYQDAIHQPLILLDGYTGSAKTAILARLAQRGVQVIDLEGMAHHRGSLLGELPSGQPSQKAFESALAVAFASLDPMRPVVIEAESSKIGRLMIPQSVWTAMRAAPRIDIRAPLAARAAFLTQAYADIIADPVRLTARLQPLRHVRGHDVVDHWEKLLAAGDFATLAAQLMSDHYDPAYARSRSAHAHEVLGVIEVATLDHTGQEQAADAINNLIAQPQKSALSGP